MKNAFWTRDELIVALSLYWKIPYNKISGSSNPLIKQYADLIGRKPAALAYKLMNFTSLDPERQQFGHKGKSGSSKADRMVWDEYYGQWAKLALDAAALTEQFGNATTANFIQPSGENSDTSNTERMGMVKIRIQQTDFRQRILAAYNESCCITGLNIPELLVASHIVPWSANEKERLNPRNGLCLNSMHDKAFDRGLITITSDLNVRLSSRLLRRKHDAAVQKYFLSVQNHRITLPDRFAPDVAFLEYHQQNIFIP